MPRPPDRPKSDRPRTGSSDRKPGGRPPGKPGSKPGGRPPGKSGSKPGGRPTTSSGSRPSRESSPRSARLTERDPRIPDEIHIEDLDPAVLNELRTLPEDLGEMVGRHLLAAQDALLDDDVDLAKAHVEAARRRAARVAAVREASGVVAYRAGDYAKALNEFRTVRRMTGNVEFVPIMADCERGLGRPERALDLLKELKTRDPGVRIEGLLVGAGARIDMGQPDAALVMLEIPELRNAEDHYLRSRLQYAYADTLERLGRGDEAQQWFAKAAESDVDNMTDAAERLA